MSNDFEEQTLYGYIQLDAVCLIHRAFLDILYIFLGSNLVSDVCVCDCALVQVSHVPKNYIEIQCLDFSINASETALRNKGKHSQDSQC